MMSKTKTPNNLLFCNVETDFHQGGIVDQNGNEVPITEKMIQQAFDKYISAWEQWKQKRQK